MALQLFIDGQEIDLYHDEKVEVTDKVQDVKDVSKLFTSYSNQFTVPATKNNNRVFSHYYNPKVFGSFDGRVKVSAVLKVNGQDFKKGNVIIESATLRQGEVSNYKIVFIGLGTKLIDALKGDKLQDLKGQSALDDLSITNWGIAEAANLLRSDGEVPGSAYENVRIPLISSKTYYIIGTDESTANELRTLIPDTRQLNSTGSDHGILIEDLRPAVKVKKVLEAVESKYDINFVGPFFDESNEAYNELFVHCNRAPGLLDLNKNQGLDAPQDLDDDTTWILNTTGIYSDFVDPFVRSGELIGSLNFPTSSIYSDAYIRNSRERMSIDVTLSNFTGIDPGDIFTVYIKDRENLETIYLSETFIYNNESTIQLGDILEVIKMGKYGRDPNYLAIQFQANSGFTVDVGVQIVLKTNYPDNNFDTTTSYVTGSAISIQGGGGVDFDVPAQLPDIKVTDFINNLYKLYNLVSYVNDDGDIYVDTFNNYYSTGNTYDITPYVDTNTIQVGRGNKFSRIEYKFKDRSKTIIGERRNTLGFGLYGDLDTSLEIAPIDQLAGDPLEVGPKLDKVVYERLDNQDLKGGNKQTDITMGWYAKQDYGAENVKTNLMYIINTANANTSSLSQYTDAPVPLYRINSAYSDVGTIYSFNYYNRPSNKYANTTLNFGDEIDEHELQYTPNISLFEKYHDLHVSNLFNPQTRLVTLTAYLPEYMKQNMELNTFIVYNGDNYLINSVKYDLTDDQGKTQFELLSYKYEDKYQAPTISLIGETSQSVNLNGTWVDLGARASDYLNNNITSDIVVTGTVDETVASDYTIEYSVTDSRGGSSAITRLVSVVSDVTAPTDVTLSLIGTTSTTIEVSATAIDNYGVVEFEFTEGFTVDGSNFNITGSAGGVQEAPWTFEGLTPSTTYTVLVKAIDDAGNISSAASLIDITTDSA